MQRAHHPQQSRSVPQRHLSQVDERSFESHSIISNAHSSDGANAAIQQHIVKKKSFPISRISSHQYSHVPDDEVESLYR